jgi:hypothetical protein
MYLNPVKKTHYYKSNGSIDKVSVYNVLGQEVITAGPKTNSATLKQLSSKRGL